jgi:hypothetical protein
MEKKCLLLKFIGETNFNRNCHCAQSMLSWFKKWIGKAWDNLILKETVALFGERIFKVDILCGFTVQEKYIAYQTVINWFAKLFFVVGKLLSI